MCSFFLQRPNEQTLAASGRFRDWVAVVWTVVVGGEAPHLLPFLASQILEKGGEIGFCGSDWISCFFGRGEHSGRGVLK